MASDSRLSDSHDAKKPVVGQESAGTPPKVAGPAPGSEPEAHAAKAGPAASPRLPAGAPADRKSAAEVPKPANRRVPPAVDRPLPVRGPAEKGSPSLPPPALGEIEGGNTQGVHKPPWLDHAGRFVLFRAVPSWLISMLFHAALLMILAVVTLPETVTENRILAVANPTDVQEIENLDNEQIDPMDVTVFENQAPAAVMASPTTTETLDIPSLDDVNAAPDQFKLEDFGQMIAPSDDLMDRIGGGMAEGLGEARGAKARKGMLQKYGGSEGSEASVAAALNWLSLHQERDGGWNIDHTRGPCKGQCSHPGMVPPSRNAATAMAILPFLGAGQTHKEGRYKETVQRGLAFLVQNMKVGNGMGDLSDSGGRLYSHGMASIALCEAYAMTNDPELLQPAQFALNFIAYAQDPVGGGWRYEPKQAGDTSVVGWQLMALKSGHMGYLKVPRRTILGANKFLDFVQEENGAKYGYTVPGAGPATTAVGLLCRMYLGWKRDEPGLQAGAAYLHQLGPSDNMYYNYYATQVLRHYGGPYWDEWNDKLREDLIKAQDRKGHETGSWYFSRDPWAERGGRLYCTSMATMILEVYYRHLPIYGKQAAEEDFPL
ncbi:MAG: prenyltransferase/squalene oxidase repeat-containing protein [Pirellulaceae bacterium]